MRVDPSLSWMLGWSWVLGFGALVFATSPAQAQMRPGGYANLPAVAAATDAGSAPPATGLMSGDDPTVVLGFTPRNGPSLIPLGEDEAAPARMRFEMTMGAGSPDRLESLGVDDAGQASWLVDPAASRAGLTIGGALHWSDWSLGGAYERTSLMGAQADLMAASIGYGALTTSFAFGQAERLDERPLDLLMLSTNLEARSWLTFESDLALGEDDKAESVAVGRLGVKLNF